MSETDQQPEIELTSISELTVGNSPESEKLADPAGNSSRYNVLGTVGQGAMGEILLARDQELRRKVAFKQIHTNMATNHKVLQRFLTEAQITAQLDHPNIVPIYSLEASPNGSIGYSMKLIQGKTFKNLLQEARDQIEQQGKALPSHQQRSLLEHFLKVCDAMFYSHTKGVIHRDLKPANIMVGPYNEVYVMDWGIAKIITQAENVVEPEVAALIHSDADEPQLERTQMGQIMGTPRYMSPQQAAGKNDLLDGSCDQFALGLILFELVTLRPAFRAGNQIELLKKVLKAELEPMLIYGSKKLIEPELQAIIRKATAQKTAARYASVAELAEDLRRFLRGDSVMARPDSPWQKVARWVGHHRELTLGLVLLMAIAGSGTIIANMVRYQAAMQDARNHEKKLSHFLLQVGQRAQLIDARFMSYEALLQRLVGNAVQLLSHAPAQPAPIYTEQDFQDPERRPPDLAMSPVYGQMVSTEHANYKISPGVSFKSILPLMQQLEPLRHTMREILLASQSEQTAFLPQAKTNQLLRNEGLPLTWTFLGLKQGLFVNYPGNMGYNPQFDARKRPWYQDALQQKGPRWLSPYIDTSGQGLMLPCSMPIYNAQHEFLGVGTIEMTLEYIKRQFLEIHNLPGVKVAYLLDGEGRVLVNSREKSQKFAKGTLINTALKLQPYTHTELIPYFRRQQPGYYELKQAGQKQVVVYYPLRALGWTYLVEANTQELQSPL